MANDRMRTAIHEAAHAVAALYCDLPLTATVLDDAGGLTAFRVPPNEDNPAHLFVLVAGSEGERLFAGANPRAAAAHADDAVQAQAEADRLSGGDGKTAAWLIHEARERCRDFLRQCGDCVQVVAMALAEHGELTGEEIAAVVSDRLDATDPAFRIRFPVPAFDSVADHPFAAAVAAVGAPRPRVAAPYPAVQDEHGRPLRLAARSTVQIPLV